MEEESLYDICEENHQENQALPSPSRPKDDVLLAELLGEFKKEKDADELWWCGAIPALKWDESIVDLNIKKDYLFAYADLYK